MNPDDASARRNDPPNAVPPVDAADPRLGPPRPLRRVDSTLSVGDAGCARPPTPLDDLLGLLSARDVDELLAEDEPGALGVGATVGEFTLVRRLGAGGMGAVWEAEQESLGRRVALKLLRRDSATRRARQLFKTEARAMARLKQAHIVTVHATGESDGRMWIAQELIEGGRTFADVLDEQRRERDAGEEPSNSIDRRTVKFFLALARAVAYAHSHGVLHRDLKPANVLVTEEGEPKIADFGLALLREVLADGGERGLTGTPSYMSPEQVAGQVYGLDERTDVFSLGVMLYEALSLRRPFESRLEEPDAARREVFERIVTHAVAPPTDPRRRVPRKLQAICSRCLEKDRGMRYPSAHALAEDLARFLDNLPLQVLPNCGEPRDGESTGEAYSPTCGHPGQYLGPFRLIRFLDRGRQGEVWEAFDTVVERPVALKIVAVEGRTQGQVDRFELEAKATARCEHSGIVRVYQSGETHGILWIAMELIEGARTLRQAIDREFGSTDLTVEDPEPVPATGPSRAAAFRQRASFFAYLAEALAAVHAHGIVHRDVKPSNILIGTDGMPRISDFGTARVLDRIGSTQTHERVGTPRYMSPEQINPDLYAIDGRSDVFALGICLYEALSGVHPFEADSAQLVQHKILHERPIDLSHLVTRLPSDLETICATALEKVRDERYESMNAFAADLLAFAEGRPIAARRPGPLRSLARWTRRHSFQVLAVAGLVAALTGLIVQRDYFVSAMGRLDDRFQDLVADRTSEVRGSVVDALSGRLGAPAAAHAAVHALLAATAVGGEFAGAVDSGTGDLARVLGGDRHRADGAGLRAAWARIGRGLERARSLGAPGDLPLALVPIDAGGAEPRLYAHLSTGAVAGVDAPERVAAEPPLLFARVADDDPDAPGWWVACAPLSRAQWSRLSDVEPTAPEAASVRAELGWIEAPASVVARAPNLAEPGDAHVPGPRPALRAAR